MAYNYAIEIKLIELSRVQQSSNELQQHYNKMTAPMAHTISGPYYNFIT